MARNVQVICNKCGKEIDTISQPCFSLNTTFGYGAPYDGEEMQLDLCQICLDELFKICKINPIITRSNFKNGE